MDQRKKGAKTPFFRNNPQWKQMHKETRVIDIGTQGPRQPPMQCWGCKGDHSSEIVLTGAKKVGLFTMYNELRQ